MSVEFREILRGSNEGPFDPSVGQDPTNWQFEYNFNQTPVGNQFSEADAQGFQPPIVEFIQGGPRPNRGIVIDGQATPQRFNHIFQTVNAPQLNPGIGVTGEIRCAVANQSGYRYLCAGLEFTYVDGAASLTICDDVDAGGYVGLSVPGASPSYYEWAGDTATLATYRLTVDDARVCRVYRDDVLIVTSGVMPQTATNGLRFIFWGEGGV